jgi:hypothetical protein
VVIGAGGIKALRPQSDALVDVATHAIRSPVSAR